MKKHITVSYVSIFVLIASLTISTVFSESALASYSVITIPVGNNPTKAVYNPTDKNIYVINTDSNTVSVIDSTTHKVVNTIPVGNNPTSILFNPSDNGMYVINSRSNNVSAIFIPPVCNAGPNHIATPNIDVPLNGSKSYDPNGGPLTYSWKQISGLHVELMHPIPVTPIVHIGDVTVTHPPQSIPLVFQLTATNNKGISSTCNTTINLKIGSTPIPQSNIKNQNLTGSLSSK